MRLAARWLRAQKQALVYQNRVLPSPQSPAQPLLRVAQTRSVSAQSRLRLKQRPLRMEGRNWNWEKISCVRLYGYYMLYDSNTMAHVTIRQASSSALSIDCKARMEAPSDVLVQL